MCTALYAGGCGRWAQKVSGFRNFHCGSFPLPLRDRAFFVDASRHRKPQAPSNLSIEDTTLQQPAMASKLNPFRAQLAFRRLRPCSSSHIRSFTSSTAHRSASLAVVSSTETDASFVNYPRNANGTSSIVTLRTISPQSPLSSRRKMKSSSRRSSPDTRRSTRKLR